MITAAHAIIYADDPEQARAFFRDVLGMPNVDIHGGWLIFKLPAAELGMATVHHRSVEETIPELERLLGVGLR